MGNNFEPCSAFASYLLYIYYMLYGSALESSSTFFGLAYSSVRHDSIDMQCNTLHSNRDNSEGNCKS